MGDTAAVPGTGTRFFFKNQDIMTARRSELYHIFFMVHDFHIEHRLVKLQCAFYVFYRNRQMSETVCLGIHMRSNPDGGEL